MVEMEKAVRKSAQGDGFRVLNIARWWICITGLIVAVPVVPDMLRNYRQWHAALVSDPSAANFWRTTFYLNVGRFALEIGLVVLIFFVLKPRPNMFGIRRDSGPRERPAPDKTDGL